MRQVIFLHQNSPAQFKNYIDYFLGNNYEVYSLTNFLVGKPNKSVKYVKVPQHGNKQKRDSSLYSSYFFRQALVDLKKQGVNPDLVFSHSGWGCGLWVKDVFPNCKFIVYSEWWFNREVLESAPFKSKWLNYGADMVTAILSRNIYMSHELNSADRIICPTVYQARQLPSFYQNKISVIYDGFDSKLFNKYDPSSLKREAPVITYAARGLEAIRCFPEFIEGLYEFYSNYPKSKVVIKIIGNDKISYGGRPPAGFKSYGKWASKLLEPQVSSGHVRFLGTLPFSKYIKELLSTSLHVYLTHPFVPSWSLAQSFCLGLPIMVNKSDSVAEFFALTPPALNINSLEPISFSNIIHSAEQNSFEFPEPDSGKTNATRRELSIPNHNSRLAQLMDAL